MTDRQPDRRLEALRLAVEMHKHHRYRHCDDDAVYESAGRNLEFLTAAAVTLAVGDPVITEQGRPARPVPLRRTGSDMAITLKDNQVATYPAPSESDSKGFPVTGDTVTIAEDSGGAVVSMTQNPDGSVAFTAVAPGAAQISWTDGTLSFADTINVTTGDAATLSVGEPVITDQSAPVPPAV